MSYPGMPNPETFQPLERPPAAPPDRGAGRAALAATGIQILTEIACAISAVLDLDQLYPVIYEQCARIFETDHFWIGRCIDDTAAQAVFWVYGGQPLVPPSRPIPVTRGLSTEVFRTRQTLRVRQYGQAVRERGLPPESGPLPDEDHAWIGVPMLVGDRLVGIIVDSRPAPFGAEDAQLLEAIAALCAVAIENAGLVQVISETAQDLMRSTQELSDLNKVASAVNRSLDLPTVLAQGADMLLRVTGWDSATVCLQGASGQWEVALHRHAGGAPGLPAPAWLSDVDGDVGRPGNPLLPFVGEAVAAGRPVVVDLAAADGPRGAALRSYREHSLRRLVIFPLRAGPAGAGAEPPVLGVLLLGSRAATSGRGTAEMLRDTTLLAIGEQLATAVQNARLLAEVQTARSHLAALLESTADGVIFYATDLRVELANRAVHQQYGLPPGALLGKTPEEVLALVAGCFVDATQPVALVGHLRTAPPDEPYMQECLLHAPRRRELQRLVRPVRDVAGAVLGRMIVYHDITEAKDLERRTRDLATLEERQHLARELHDSVTQSLFTITLMAEAAQAMAARDPARVMPYLERLKSTAGAALDEMRALLAQLRPPAMSAGDLGAALRRHAETVTQQMGLAVAVEVAPEIGPLPAPLEEALYRITQEALHNVVKHAAARQARVALARMVPGLGSRPPALLLTVEDDGCGFDPTRPAPTRPGSGLGFPSMRERATALGGHLTVDSAPGRGSRITVMVPLPD